MRTNYDKLYRVYRVKFNGMLCKTPCGYYYTEQEALDRRQELEDENPHIKFEVFGKDSIKDNRKYKRLEIKNSVLSVK